MSRCIPPSNPRDHYRTDAVKAGELLLAEPANSMYGANLVGHLRCNSMRLIAACAIPKLRHVRSRYGLPCRAPDNPMNRANSDIKSLSQSLLGYIPAQVQADDFLNVIDSEFGGWRGYSGWCVAFCCAVVRVIASSSFKKMRRIRTRWIVACVAGLKFFKILAVVNEISYAIGSQIDVFAEPLRDAQNPISVRDSAFPWPALVWTALVYEGPETGYIRFGQAYRYEFSLGGH